MDKYILVEGIVFPATLMEWARWMESDTDFSKRRIARTEVNGYEVSTVFLGLDHAFRGEAPMIFETMVFGEGEMSGKMERYSTLDEAKTGHKVMIKRCEDSKHE